MRLNHPTISRRALVLALAIQAACLDERAVHGNVVVHGEPRALASGQLVSVDGSYGAACADRSGSWSLAVVMGATLAHPRLSVVTNDSDCELTLTALRTPTELLSAMPAIALTTSYGASASTFAATSPFRANARLSALSFSEDFVLTILYPSDPVFLVSTNTAIAIPPTVSDNTPPDGSLNRSIATKPTATFSVTMDPLTITDATFTLTEGVALVPVSGEVTYDALARTAAFAPDAILGLDELYTATITTGVRDTGNTALAMNHVWTFRTAEFSQAPIELGAAAAFAVLARAEVTNVGATSVTGELGSDTSITDFPPGTVVMGTTHTSDAAVTQAMLDLNSAYAVALGRMLNPISVSGDIGTMTFLPGLYRAAAALEIASGNVVLDAQQDPAAVFIFQIGSTWNMSAGSEIVLMNDAQASNVYWQVGSSATLGANAVLHGTILADQTITLGMEAEVYGRALARDGAITMSLNTVVRPTP